MSDDVRILVDPGARRWQLIRVGAAGQTTPVPTGDPGIALGRDTDGAVVEMIIDHATLGPAALARIGEHFGTAVRDELAMIDPTVVTERVLHGGQRSPARVATAALPPSGDQGMSITRQGHLIRATLLHSVGIATWVRVMSARTGALLAVAAIEHRDGEPPAIEFTFGLEIDLDDLRFEPTDNPFRSDDDHRSSVTDRVDDLLNESERVGRFRPGRGARIADGAALLADSVNDVSRRKSAGYLAAGLRRSMRTRLISGVAAVAVAGFVVAMALFMGDSDSVTVETTEATVSDTVPSTTSTDPGTDAAATTATTASTGPLIATYPSGDSVLMAMVGASAEVSPGGLWPVNAIEFTTRETGVFGSVADGIAAAENRCRVGNPSAFTIGALSQLTAMVHLRPVDEPTVATFLIGALPANPQEEFLQAVPESCGDLAEMDGQYVAEYSLERAGQSATFDIPPTVTPGLWEAFVTLELQEPDSIIGGIVVEVVSDS